MNHEGQNLLNPPLHINMGYWTFYDLIFYYYLYLIIFFKFINKRNFSD